MKFVNEKKKNLKKINEKKINHQLSFSATHGHANPRSDGRNRH